MHHLLPVKTEHISHNDSLLAFHILRGQQNLLQNLGQNYTAQLRKNPKWIPEEPEYIHFHSSIDKSQ